VFEPIVSLESYSICQLIMLTFRGSCLCLREPEGGRVITPSQLCLWPVIIQEA
jgi:hypothetical protein